MRWPAEPWSGDLHLAPILFVSSNPSSGDPDESPAPGDLTESSSDEEILHTFLDAFREGPWIGISEGVRQRAADGAIGKHVQYWASCKARATELLGYPAKPGIDYAMTEVVHCGSQREIGVRSAAIECVPRYLQRVIALSPAVAVVVVGAVARDVIRTMVPQAAGTFPYCGPLEWAGRSRHILFVPAPNARRVPKGIAANLGADALTVIDSIREALARPDS